MFNFFNNASPPRAAVTPRGLRGALGPARLWLAMVCLVPVWLAIPWCGCFNSAQGAEPNLLSGEALRAHLDDKIGATWAAAPLRQALYDLAQSQHIAVLLDRRIDPGQALDLTLQDAPLGQGLEQLATREKLGECLVGSVLYFGPPQTAARLRTVAALRHEEIGALPLALRPKFLHSRSWKWDDLATPRELLGELGREVGSRFVGGEQIPHDLWAGGNWPAESWADRMSLILAQYDLTFSISAAGDVIKFIPLPAAPVLTRTYPVGANLAAAADRAKHAAPAVECSTAGAKLTVTASAEDQDRVAAALKGPSSQKTAAKETKKIDKLAAQNVPVGKLLTALGQKLDLKVELDEAAIRAAGISLDQLVSVNVQNGTLDDVFRAATMRTGLGYRLHEKSVEVFPADKK